MYKTISKIWILLFSNFFFIVLIKRLLEFIFLDIYLFQILYVTSGLLGFLCILKIKNKTIIDFIVITYIIYITLNAILIDYPHHWQYVYKAFIFQYAPIFCFFIGRTHIISISEVVEKMKYPILFAMIAGLFFYFTNPSWYVLMKELQLKGNTNETMIQEIYRLSSFWGHPYYIGYATAIYTFYMFYRLKTYTYKKKWPRYTDIVITTLCIVTLLLAQLRITIAGLIIAYIYFNFSIRQNTFIKLSKLLISLCIGFGGVSILFQQISPETSNYIIEHINMLFEHSTYTGRFESTSGGIELDTFCGNGFGRYDVTARSYDKFAIVDNEFQNHLAELGYLGLFLLIYILLYTLLKILRYGKQQKLESSIFIFYSLALVGASVLSNETQYNYIMWFVIGNLCSLPIKSKIDSKKFNKSKDYVSNNFSSDSCI